MNPFAVIAVCAATPTVVFLTVWVIDEIVQAVRDRRRKRFEADTDVWLDELFSEDT
jgi:hypothetical protein